MMTANRANERGKILWLCLTFLAFFLALGLSWIILSSVNFGYEYLYHAIGIDQHIAKYAPHNPLKADFVMTTDAERFRLFAAVVQAIHQHGEGLAELSYKSPQGQVMQQLFTHDEVVHLQDVAILVERMKWLLMVVIAWFVLLSAWLYQRRIAMPPFWSLLAYVLLTLVVVTVIILAIGVHDVFSQLHIWAFPQEHKWLFYYQESLMSTMMKAPDLFGYIAVLLMLVAVIIFVLIMAVWRKLQVSRINSSHNQS
ncbi:MAG: DUF1461 domain-containing protein [Proteobacteria bacterium]|nr:MAG: DUF1461 domain-containing protein [Pseudomonadota bacterium]